VLRSAVANAEHNHQVRNLDDLRVVQAFADGGPSLKRVQPRAMGRAFFIKHRMSHLTIGVSDEVNGGAMAPPMRRVTAPRHAPAPAAKIETPKADRAAKAPAKAKASGKGSSTKASDKKPPRTPKSKEKK
jgi:hypothetical protein